MAAKRIQLIKDFVEKTAKRLLDYPDIAKQLHTNANSFLHKGKEIDKKLFELLKPEIAYSNKAVKENYYHIDSNARLYIQCILTTFEKTYKLLQDYEAEYDTIELEHPSPEMERLLDLARETRFAYGKEVKPIKALLIPIDAKLIRQDIHPSMRGKTRRLPRTSPVKLSVIKESTKSKSKRTSLKRKKSVLTARQRYTQRARKERLNRVREVHRKRLQAIPIYHPTVAALPESKRLRAKTTRLTEPNEDAMRSMGFRNMLFRSRRHPPSPQGNYSPVRPVNDVIAPLGDMKNENGMKPFGQTGRLPPLRPGTIRRARIHTNENE